MSIKNKILNILTSNPKLANLGIGLAITFVVVAIIGTIETQQANAAVIVTIGKPEKISRIP